VAAAGWRDVELADTAPGRITVTAAREGLGLSGVVEEAAPGCRGAPPPGSARTPSRPEPAGPPRDPACAHAFHLDDVVRSRYTTRRFRFIPT
jgi:hypothetical protein